MFPKYVTIFTLLLSLPCSAAKSQSNPLLVPGKLIVPAQFSALFDSSRDVNCPPGFQVSVYYAGGLAGARFMDFDPNGRLAVAVNGQNRVIAIADTNGDGVGDTAITIATNTQGAHSIAFHDSSLYAASSTQVLRYTHPDANGVYQSRSVFIDNIGAAAQGSPNHTTRTILFDDRTNSIFLSLGSPCNVCREIDTTRSAILRFNQDGTGKAIYASGLRNAVGLAIDSNHQLWASIAERNGLGADVPEDFITRVRVGGYYGWPFAFGNHQWVNFSVSPEYSVLLPLTHADSLKVAGMEVPDLGLQAHSTPLGIMFYTADQFPAGYRHAMFAAVHGSTQAEDGRLIADGSKIVVVRFPDGVAMSEDFITGFLTDSIKYGRWARPAGIIADKKGNLYFSSDNDAPHAPQAIYKISYAPARSVEARPPESHIRIVYAAGESDLVFVHGPAELTQSGIQIFNNIGTLTNVTPAQLGAGYFSIDLRSLPKGAYWITVHHGSEEKSQLVVR